MKVRQVERDDVVVHPDVRVVERLRDQVNSFPVITDDLCMQKSASGDEELQADVK